MLALVLCHNVTPTYPNEDDPTYKEYQASSPDEVALVKFANTLELKLEHREELEIKILNTNNQLEEYEILANFPFVMLLAFVSTQYILGYPLLY